MCNLPSKNFNKVLVNFLINILSKIRIVKDKEAAITKWSKTCDDYYENAKVLLHNKSIFIKCTMYQVISLGIYYALPLFIAYSLNLGENLTLLNTIAASSYGIENI